MTQTTLPVIYVVDFLAIATGTLLQRELAIIAAARSIGNCNCSRDGRSFLPAPARSISKRLSEFFW